MIIGNGDIASALKTVDRLDRLFFASGVSNSRETKKEEFERERKLLLRQDYDKHIVYFSTLSIFYSNTPYVKHKKEMETLIKTLFEKRTIVRLGNISWGSNPHTLINYFRNKIAKGEKYIMIDAYRHIVDLDEFLYWMKLIPEWNCEFNITGKFLKVKDVVNLYGHVSIPAKQ